MKTKKQLINRILSLMLSLVMVLGLLPTRIISASATGDHTHQFEGVFWDFDSNGHWHRCIEEDCEITDYSATNEVGTAYGAHADADTDGICDICDYHITHEHTGWTELTADVLVAKSYTLGDGKYYLTDNLDTIRTICIDGNVSLCLSGKTIKANASMSNPYQVIEIKADSLLDLYDCSGTHAGRITGGSARNGSGVIGYGTFRMFGGTITENNKDRTTKDDSNGDGAAVWVNTEFIMYGGRIYNNNAVYGGGVASYYSKNTFNMSGGKIYGNKADTVGGVYVGSKGLFDISGGEITNNITTGEIGGGVFIDSDSVSFTLSGRPVISENKKGDKTAHITATDIGSGVKNIEYFVSDRDLIADKTLSHMDAAIRLEAAVGNHWATYNNDIALNNNSKNVIYAKITDNVGNISYISSEGIVLDATVPVIEGIENGKTYYTTQRFTVKESNLESVTVNGNPSMTFALGGNVDKEYVIVATDKAGNATTVTVKMKPIKVLAKATENLGNDNVTSADAPVLKELVEKLDELIADPDTSDDGERETLQQHKVIAESLLKTIEDAAKAVDTENTEKVKGVTAENVTAEDKTDLEKAKVDLEKALEVSGGNYTEDEKKSIRDEIKRIEAALAELNKPVTDSDTPQTGDNTNLWLWVVLLFVSSTGIFGITLYDRKRRTASKK